MIPINMNQNYIALNIYDSIYTYDNIFSNIIEDEVVSENNVNKMGPLYPIILHKKCKKQQRSKDLHQLNFTNSKNLNGLLQTESENIKE